ncbi:tail fiber assembly protein [Escherichia coli]|uniref:tail fiber assembly protein n=1 Tax=Escherichia coli TaxID=562 RepID=UPI003917C3DE
MKNYIFCDQNDKYSPAVLNSFYRVADKADYEKAGTWPDKFVEVTDDEFAEFTGTAPVGKVLASAAGKPEWIDIPAPTHDVLVSLAEQNRQSLIDSATRSISIIQLKLQAGRKLTQAETTRLNAVLDYIDAVTATDTSTAPDVIWPELPEA